MFNCGNSAEKWDSASPRRVTWVSGQLQVELELITKQFSSKFSFCTIFNSPNLDAGTCLFGLHCLKNACGNWKLSGSWLSLSELNEQQDQQLSPSWWLQELWREALSLLAVIPPGVHLFFPKVHQRDSQGITELQKEAICLNSWESGEQKKKPGFLALLQNFAVIQWCRTIEIGDC